MKSSKINPTNKNLNIYEKQYESNKIISKIPGFNKSIDKYIQEKIKDTDNEKQLIVRKNISIDTGSGNYFNNNHGIRRQSPNYKNIKINSSFSESKIIKQYLDTKNHKKENEKILNDITIAESDNLKKNKEILKDIYNITLKTHLKVNKSPKNEKSNILEISSSEKLEIIKKSLIELVNDTKDKKSILNELDNIYKNVLKVSNQISQNNLADEDSNLNITRSMSNLGMESNYNNISQYSLGVSTSLSKPSSSINHNNSNKDLEGCTNNSNVQLENDSLREENFLLKKKIEEIDTKFERLLQQNVELKGYVKNKSENFDTMSKALKKFENELKEVKKYSANNCICTSNNIMQISNSKKKLKNNQNNNLKNKENIKVLIISNNSSNQINSSNISSNNSNNNLIKKIFNKSKNQNKLSYKCNKENIQNLTCKNTPSPIPHGIKYLEKSSVQNDEKDFQEECSNMHTIMSIENLKEDDAKQIYYYPTKFSNQTQKIKSIPSLHFSYQQEIITDSPQDSKTPTEYQVDEDLGFLERDTVTQQNGEYSYNYSEDSL